MRLCWVAVDEFGEFVPADHLVLSVLNQAVEFALNLLDGLNSIVKLQRFSNLPDYKSVHNNRYCAFCGCLADNSFIDSHSRIELVHSLDRRRPSNFQAGLGNNPHRLAETRYKCRFSVSYLKGHSQ